MNILIAMDESDYAKKAVRYVAATVNPAVRITLFSVLPTISAQLERELHHPLFAEKIEQLKGVGEEKKKVVKARIEKCRTILKDAGVPDKHIGVKIVSKEVGIARDIIAEAERGSYDTVVVGRRGLSAAAAFVLGSVSNKIVQNIKNCTVWVVE
jgi:nucleotide-binding universal stress UspA family protein